MKAIGIVISVIVGLYIFGSIIEKVQQSQTKEEPKKIEFFMNEPLNVTGLDITVTNVKETKKIHTYKAKNIFLQVFITVKNNRSNENSIPMLALINKSDGHWICDIDRRFYTDEKYNDYLLTGFEVAPNQIMKGYVPFSCDSYLNEKAGPRKSKPSDFKMFVYNKLQKEGGYIFLEEKQNENN